VLIELEQGLGIVNQYVGVQDVSLFHISYVTEIGERAIRKNYFVPSMALK
jgi:hypothetical protein